MAIKAKEERVTLRIDADLKKQVEKIADDQGISLSKLIRLLIEDLIKSGKNLT